jgi:hypothetical protein
MSQPDLTVYLEQYSRLVDLMVRYHNRHLDFRTQVTTANSKELKTILRNIRYLEREMQKSIDEAHRTAKNKPPKKRYGIERVKNIKNYKKLKIKPEDTPAQ